MDLDLWFSSADSFATLGWAVLILSPWRRKWMFQITGLIMPALLAIAYAVLIVPNFTSVEGAGYGSLSQARALFSADVLLLAGWIHFLAFDLAVGTYVAKRSDAIGLSRLIQAPILLLCFMFGPIGFMIFVLIKGLRSVAPHQLGGSSA